MEDDKTNMEDEAGQSLPNDRPTSFSRKSPLNSLLPFLFSPTKQRQNWDDTQISPHVNWGDLFFDLFYVSAAYNLGTILKYSPSSKGVLYFVGSFGPVMGIWMNKLFFDSRFETGDDVWHRGFEVVHLCVLGTAVLHIRPVDVLSNPSENGHMFAFCVALLISSFMTILTYLEIMLKVEGGQEAKHTAKNMIKHKLTDFCFYLAAAVVAGVAFYDGNGGYRDHRRVAETATYENETTSYDESNDIPIYLCLASWVVSNVVALVEFIIYRPTCGGDHKKYFVPMNVDFAVHRYGEWIMLMLGESILSLLIEEVTGSLDYYITFFASLLSVILLQYLHFKSQPHEADDHAIRRSLSSGVVFIVLMQIYSASLIAIGVAFKLLLIEYTYQEEAEHEDNGEGDNHRYLHLLEDISSPALDQSRHLALAKLNYSTEDRKQHIANLFSGSMAIAFFSLDIIVLTHKGLQKNVSRCKCKITKTVRMRTVMFAIMTAGLIVYMATLWRYVTGPEKLALLGFVGIVAQVFLRVIGDGIFHQQEKEGEQEIGCETEAEKKDNEIGAHCEDEKWPNVTQPEIEMN